MLTIFGKPHERGGYCDGFSRRDFLTVGGTLVGGALALPNLLASGSTDSHKAMPWMPSRAGQRQKVERWR